MGLEIRVDRTTESRIDKLHPVADPENRQVPLPRPFKAGHIGFVTSRGCRADVIRQRADESLTDRGATDDDEPLQKVEHGP